MKMLRLLLVLFFALPAHAKTESITLADISLDELYPNSPQVSTAYAPPQTAYTRPQEDSIVLTAYFKLLASLNAKKISLQSWLRNDHLVYLLDGLTAEEKKQLASAFEQINNQVLSGVHSTRRLMDSMDPLVRLKVKHINTQVQRLKDDHKSSIILALAKHETELNQQYAGNPYSYHLRHVRRVLKRFGFGPKNSLLGLQLGTAAWLHDILEDTDLKYGQIAKLFGREIADIVKGVSKMPRREGMTKEAQLRMTYERTAIKKGSRILKLADRIANVEEGVTRLFFGQPTKLHKYIAEWELFRSILYVPGEADEMWTHLERLLTDLNYAQSFALVNFPNLDKIHESHEPAPECREVL